MGLTVGLRLLRGVGRDPPVVAIGHRGEPGLDSGSAASWMVFHRSSHRGTGLDLLQPAHEGEFGLPPHPAVLVFRATGHRMGGRLTPQKSLKEALARVDRGK